MRLGSGLLLLGGDLLALALTQQSGHLLGLQQSRQPQVLLLLDTADHGAGPELAAVEEDTVELGLAVHGLEAGQQICRGVLGLVGLGEQTVLGAEESILLRRRVRAAQDVVAGHLHLAGQSQ